MQRSNNALYSKHPSIAIETPGELLKTANPADNFWTSTIVNPAKNGSMTQKALFWVHIGLWVISVALSATNNFAVNALQAKSNSSDGDCMDNSTDCFMADPTTTSTTIGILGGVATILGVIALLAGAAVFDADSFKTQVWLNCSIQFLTLFGTFSTIFVFSRAAMETSTAAYWVGLFAVLFCSYAQVLLYCTSATLDVMALPRAFLPCAALSIQLISAIAIQGDDFHSHTAHPFTDGQKMVAWALPSTLGAAILFMIGLRRYTRDANEISQLGDFPFLRSLVLFPFLTAATLSTYKLSFLKQDDDPVSYMFGLAGMLLTYAIVTIVFVPSGMSSGSS